MRLPEMSVPASDSTRRLYATDSKSTGSPEPTLGCAARRVNNHLQAGLFQEFSNHLVADWDLASFRSGMRSGSRWICHSLSAAKGIENQFHAARYAQLVEYPKHVVSYGVLGQVELQCNFLVPHLALVNAGLGGVRGNCVSITHVPFSRSPHGEIWSVRPLVDRRE